MRKILLFAVVFLALTSYASAYIIQGDTVIEEDAFSKISVYPATAWNPLGKDYTQTFTLLNKTGSQQDVYIAYKFDNQLVDGQVEYFQPPVYVWNNYAQTCAPPLVYDANLNVYPGQQNPNRIRCYRSVDLNNGGPSNDINVLVYDANFNDYNLPAHTVYVDYLALGSGNKWNDITNMVSHASILNDDYYYTDNPVSFGAGESKKWRITYTPNPLDTTNKWELAYYTGSGPGCILTDTCDYVLWLDPWWDSDYLYKIPITLNTDGIGLTGNITNDHPILIHIPPSLTDFWSNVDSTGKDVRFINTSETSAFSYHFENWNYAGTDANVWVEITDTFTSGSDLIIYMYYGNASATDGQDITGTYPSDINNVYHFGEASAPIIDKTTQNYDLNAVGSLQYQSVGRIGYSTNKGASLTTNYINQPTLWDGGVGSYSVSMWFKLNSAFSGSDYNGLIEKNNLTVGEEQPIRLERDGATGGIRYGVKGNAASAFCSSVNTTWTAGAWYQLVAIRDSNGNQRLIVNGNPALGCSTATGPSGNIPAGSNGDFSIGHNYLESPVDSLAASIDELRIWNRVLSDNEARLIYNSETDNLLTFGAQIKNGATPDVNIVFPNTSGLEIFGFRTIDFNLFDADFNVSAPYDYNITARRTDTNANTPIVVDGNAFTICSNMDSNATVKTCLYDYNFSMLTLDANYVLDINVSDGESRGLDTSAYFTIISGLNTFTIVDEETGTGLQAVVSINDVNYSVDVNGNVDYNAIGITYPATIRASMTGYDTRAFTFRSDSSIQALPNLSLRTASETQDIKFKFYAPDKTSILSNRSIRVGRGAWLSSIGITNSEGEITFNLAPQDANYDFNVFVANTDFGDANKEYHYTPIRITVLNPKDETTDANISSPSGFDFDVGGLGLTNISGQTTFPFSTIYILGNTVDPYTLRVVDENSDGQQYFARQYILLETGDTNTLTIQPYLIGINDGILTNIRVIDIPTNLTIPNIRLILQKGIAGSTVVVEDRLTESTGVAQVVMLSQSTYTVGVWSANKDTNYFSGTISPVESSLSIYINYTSSNDVYKAKNINFSIAADGDRTKSVLTGTTALIDFNVSTNYDVNYILVQVKDGNVVRHSSTTTSTSLSDSFNLTLSDYDANRAIVYITISSQDKNFLITKTYTILGNTPGQGIGALSNLRETLDDNSILLVIVLVLLASVAILGPGLFGNNEAAVFPIAAIMGLLVYILLPAYTIYMVAAIFLAAVAWMWVRSVR